MELSKYVRYKSDMNAAKYKATNDSPLSSEYEEQEKPSEYSETIKNNVDIDGDFTAENTIE